MDYFPSETFTFQENTSTVVAVTKTTEVVKDVRECVLTDNVAEPVKP